MVGLCGVIAAKRLGAERIIILGRHPGRIELARAFGATDVVSERGGDAIEHVRKLTKGQGAHSVLECVGTRDAAHTAVEIARAGGAVGRVGVPHYDAMWFARFLRARRKFCAEFLAMMRSFFSCDGPGKRRTSC